MAGKFIRFRFAAILSPIAVMLWISSASGQDYDRYKPRSVTPRPAPRSVAKEDLPAVEGSDRVLVESLDAVIVLDHQDKVDPDDAHEESVGIEYDFDAAGSLVRSAGFRRIVERYLGREITLRNLNEMSRELILYYRKQGQPVVDIFVPEQRITAGTVQLVVIESRVGRVVIEDGMLLPTDAIWRSGSLAHVGGRAFMSPRLPTICSGSIKTGFDASTWICGREKLRARRTCSLKSMT